MTGISDLSTLLATATPHLCNKHYVFCCLTENIIPYFEKYRPIATMQEQEGVTFVLEADKADLANLAYHGRFRKITLTVHSSLQAVGLTAAFSKALTDENISANVIAGFYHDHIFVALDDADKAMTALIRLQQQHQQ